LAKLHKDKIKLTKTFFLNYIKHFAEKSLTYSPSNVILLGKIQQEDKTWAWGYSCDIDASSGCVHVIPKLLNLKLKLSPNSKQL
jgi:hypothetical protein